MNLKYKKNETFHIDPIFQHPVKLFKNFSTGFLQTNIISLLTNINLKPHTNK